MLRAISPLPAVFSTRLENFLPFSPNLKLSSVTSFSLDQSRILSFGKKLNNGRVGLYTEQK